MLIYRVRGSGVAKLLSLLDTGGWEAPLRLGVTPATPRQMQVLLAERFYLRNNSTMGLVLSAEREAGDTMLVTIHTLGGKAGVLRTRFGANDELEQEGRLRLETLAREQGWELTTVQEYHHGG